VSNQVDVEYVSKSGWVDRQRLSRSSRREHRQAKSLPTDEDLYYYLVMEFAMVPRSCDLLRQMVIKAKNYMYKFDLTKYSNEEVYKIIMGAVRSAMAITP